MSYDERKFRETIRNGLITLVVMTFVLVAGMLIGKASAHSAETNHRHQMECLDRNGHIEYINDVGSTCVVGGPDAQNR